MSTYTFSEADSRVVMAPWYRLMRRWEARLPVAVVTMIFAFAGELIEDGWAYMAENFLGSADLQRAMGSLIGNFEVYVMFYRNRPFRLVSYAYWIERMAQRMRPGSDNAMLSYHFRDVRWILRQQFVGNNEANPIDPNAGDDESNPIEL